MITYSFAGEEFALLMMALALGMDAFSVSLGMGTMPIRKRQIAKAGVVIGGFHVLMPLGGLFIGGLISKHFGQIAMIAGGAISSDYWRPNDTKQFK